MDSVTKPRLTIFYDGSCPLCVNEIRHLGRLDEYGLLRFADIQQVDFNLEFPFIDRQEANRILLALNQHGKIIKGLDVTYEAWNLVGRGWLVAPLTWRWLRFFADPVYLWFARNRYTISGLLTGQRRCPTGECRTGECRTDSCQRTN